MIKKIQEFDETKRLKITGIGLVIYLVGFYFFDINPSFTASINNMFGIGS
jgi:hypothetical protein